jgi:hypothetical protein
MMDPADFLARCEIGTAGIDRQAGQTDAVIRSPQ